MIVVLQVCISCVRCRNLVLFLPSETEPMTFPFRRYPRFVLTMSYPEELITIGMCVTLGLVVTRPRNWITVVLVLTSFLLTPMLSIRVLPCIRVCVILMVLVQWLLPTSPPNVVDLAMP